MTEQLICDLAKFRSLKSCKDTQMKSPGVHCALGKLAVACGVSNSSQNEYWKNCNNVLLKIFPCSDFEGWDKRANEIANINNSGKFKEADNLALQCAMESGKVKFINAIKEEDKALIDKQVLPVF